MAPAGRRQELQHYVPPHRSGGEMAPGAAGSNQWRESTSTQRSHWHDERTVSPEQEPQQQQQRSRLATAAAEPPPLTGSLYDSGSWTDQVEEELGERLGSISLSWATSGTGTTAQHQQQQQPTEQERYGGSPRKGPMTSGGGGGYQVPPRFAQARQLREVKSPPGRRGDSDGGGRQQQSHQYQPSPSSSQPSRGRGRGFQPRHGPPFSTSTGGEPPRGASMPLSGSPPRWRDRPDYRGNEYQRSESGRGGGGGWRERDQFNSVDRDEEEEERYSVVSSSAGRGEGSSSRPPVVADLRETLENKRRGQQQLLSAARSSPDEESERQNRKDVPYSASNRGSQSSLNSVGKRSKRNRGRKEGGRNRGGGGGGDQNSQQQRPPNLPRPKKNTENFNPSYAPPEMRILFAAPGAQRFTRSLSTRDVLVVADLFCSAEDLRLYDQLLCELEQSGLSEQQLWQSWHGDSHVIADDKKRWKEQCPTFHYVLDRIRDYFDMDIKATRLNWYRSTADWKPFHHDAAAVKPDMAKTQNFTVAVSFGVERDAAFEHAQTKTVIALPQPNGTVYTFGRDVNVLWRHGIPQLPPDRQTDQGRISIIAWGWLPQFQL